MSNFRQLLEKKMTNDEAISGLRDVIDSILDAKQAADGELGKYVVGGNSDFKAKFAKLGKILGQADDVAQEISNTFEQSI